MKSRCARRIDDARYWVERKSYPPGEIAVRFHHKLVAIHPFPNGNGRWSRLAADVFALRLGQERFTWGRGSIVAASETRQAYVRALKAADAGDQAGVLLYDDVLLRPVEIFPDIGELSQRRIASALNTPRR